MLIYPRPKTPGQRQNVVQIIKFSSVQEAPKKAKLKIAEADLAVAMQVSKSMLYQML